MAAVGQPAVERLRTFLRGLPPGSRAQLIAELERALLRGDDVAGSELILHELRQSFRDNDPQRQRIGEAARLFFAPLEPLLIDEAVERLLPGRIPRSHLTLIWSWLTQHAMPTEAQAFVAAVEAATAAHDTVRASQLTRDFQDRAVVQIAALIAASADSDKAARRLGAQVGTPRGVADLNAVLQAMTFRDRLDALSSRLPGHIRQFTNGALENARAALAPHAAGPHDLFVAALVVTMGRLAAPWQLIRLATRAAQSDAAARINETPYAATVDIVLGEIERMVCALADDLRHGRRMGITALLKDLHDAVRGVRSELDLPADSSWGRQLASLRATISRMLTAEIENGSGQVRRLVRLRPAREIAPGAVMDAGEVADAESLIGFVMACRRFAGELAINEICQRVFTDLQQSLDAGTRTLLDALRATGEAERPFRQSQVDAAVRFCAALFGSDYAALLTKAADVAAHSQDRTPPSDRQLARA